MSATEAREAASRVESWLATWRPDRHQTYELATADLQTLIATARAPGQAVDGDLAALRERVSALAAAGLDVCVDVDREGDPVTAGPDNADLLEANEKLGEALTEVGMILGLAKPTPGATWGAREVIERAHAIVDMPLDPGPLPTMAADVYLDATADAIERARLGIGDGYRSLRQWWTYRASVRAALVGVGRELTTAAQLVAYARNALVQTPGAPPEFAVGDPVETSHDLDRLSAGTVLRNGRTFLLAWRHANGWSCNRDDAPADVRAFLLDQLDRGAELRVVDLPPVGAPTGRGRS